jgi:hypothetical protein
MRQCIDKGLSALLMAAPNGNDSAKAAGECVPARDVTTKVATTEIQS